MHCAVGMGCVYNVQLSACAGDMNLLHASDGDNRVGYHAGYLDDKTSTLECVAIINYYCSKMKYRAYVWILYTWYTYLLYS